MKACYIIVSIIIALFFDTGKASGQSEETQQLVLNIEKLRQFKKILQDMYKGYQVLSQGYQKVKDIAEGNFKLHKSFLDGLMEVSPSVRNYKRVADIVSIQIKIVKEYKSYAIRFKQDSNFTVGELEYILSVYANLTNESLKNIESLMTVITADKLRMSDDERLQAIDRLFNDMQEKLSFLRYFNNNTSLLAIQRAREKNEIDGVRMQYGIRN